ncbi:MAG TPA: IS256 family transposase [Thermoanaerobaculia bacterium]|nr:IS256 family transposase [Thermoanaerobaculia bacterium]
MKKHPARKSKPSEGPNPGFIQQRVLPLMDVIVALKDGLRELVVSSGMQVLEALLEDDREKLCGPRKKPQVEREAYRYGYDQGQLVMGGRKVSVAKPRVRRVAGGEVTLPAWEAFRGIDPLNERVVEQMLCGVSTRKYERSLEPLDQERRAIGVKKSSVSRQFIMATSQKVSDFVNRPLDDLDLPIIMIDGLHVGEHVVLGVMGIDASGRKHVLGLCEGPSESERVCRGLFRNLIDRGLVVERARLFVIDGSAGLRKAIRQTFGQWALIQRCQLHKLRNVLDHLPERKREWARAKMHKAWESASVEKARHILEDLARSLGDHPGAAASVREGLDETLTLLKLGVTGALYRTLRTTNPIENLQGTIRRVTRNVRRWRDGSMVVRWVATAFMEAELRFRRIKGVRDMPRFLSAIDRATGAQTQDVQKIA